MPFELSVTPEEVSVQAGQSAGMTVRIRNLGAAEEEYAVEVLGLDASVYRMPQSSVRVPAESAGELTLTLCPPAGGNIRAASYRFRIRTGSVSREQNTATATVTIEPALALKLDLVRTGRGRFDVRLSSEANRELEVELMADDKEETTPARSCDFYLERSHVRLPEGESVRVPLRVQPRRRPLFGAGGSHPFIVTATPEIRNARSEAAEGVARSSPVVPWWLPLLLLLGLGGGAVTLMDRPDAPPPVPAPVTRPAPPVGSASLALREARLDFGRVPMGQTKKLAVHVERQPGAPASPIRLREARISDPASYAIASPRLPVTLESGGQAVEVLFAPKSPGSKSATLTVTTGPPPGDAGATSEVQTLTVELRGEGTPAG